MDGRGDRRVRRFDLLLQHVAALPGRPDAEPVDSVGGSRSRCRRQSRPKGRILGDLACGVAAGFRLLDATAGIHSRTFFSRLQGMLLVAGVKGSAVLLTVRRFPRKLLRRRAEPVGVAQPEPKRLEDVLADAEPTLRRLARRMCENSGDVHDLLQDTFERACRHGIPQGIHCTRAWLTTIMHRLFLDRCRAAARHPRPEVLDETLGIASFEQDALEPPWGRITIEDIRAALDQIEQVYRDVYVLHTFDDLSYEDIARELSIERITVGTRLSRARKRLREVLVKRFGLESVP